MFQAVWRRNLSSPGFDWLDYGCELNSRGLRERMLDLARSFSDSLVRRCGQGLAIVSMGRFDQQMSTRFHLDGAPDASLLLLGYEPSEVRSTLSIADYSRCAVKLGLSPTEFLDRFNPLFPVGEAALACEVTHLPAVRPGCSRLVAINNSRLPLDTTGRNTPGVLHRGTIPLPDHKRSRVVNSVILAPSEHRELDFDRFARDFIESDAISGPAYRSES